MIIISVAGGLTIPSTTLMGDIILPECAEVIGMQVHPNHAGAGMLFQGILQTLAYCWAVSCGLFLIDFISFLFDAGKLDLVAALLNFRP